MVESQEVHPLLQAWQLFVEFKKYPVLQRKQIVSETQDAHRVWHVEQTELTLSQYVPILQHPFVPIVQGTHYFNNVVGKIIVAGFVPEGHVVKH